MLNVCRPFPCSGLEIVSIICICYSGPAWWSYYHTPLPPRHSPQPWQSKYFLCFIYLAARLEVFLAWGGKFNTFQNELCHLIKWWHHLDASSTFRKSKGMSKVCHFVTLSICFKSLADSCFIIRYRVSGRRNRSIQIHTHTILRYPEVNIVADTS